MQLEKLDQEEKLVNEEEMENLAGQGKQDSQDRLADPVNKGSEDNVESQDQQENKGLVVNLDLLDQLAQLEDRVNKGLEVQSGLLVSKGPVGDRESKDHVDRLEVLVLKDNRVTVVAVAPMAKMVVLGNQADKVQLENLDNEEHQVREVKMDVLEKLDHKDKEDHPDNQVQMVRQVNLAHKDQLDRSADLASKAYVVKMAARENEVHLDPQDLMVRLPVVYKYCLYPKFFHSKLRELKP